MKSPRRWALVAVVAVAALAGASNGAAGPKTTTTDYTVSGQGVPGATTGLVLEGGTVTVTAAGAVCPYGDNYCPGPNGNATVDTSQSWYGGFVLPGAPAWGLVARVGNGPWVQVGSGPTTLSGTGELVFAVNDDLFWDNAGSFTVTVTSECWPGWGYGDLNHDHCGPPGLDNTPTSAAGAGGGSNAAPNGNALGRTADAPNGNGKGNGLAKH